MDVLKENNEDKLRGMNMITIKFWDNEDYEYPIVRIDYKDIDLMKSILEEYRKSDSYNFDDFIAILKEKNVNVEVIYYDMKLFF
jgi:hypothetical protein